MAQQTAVEWLIEKQLDAGIGLPKEWREQAKQMEKEQMIDLIRFLRIQDKMGKSVEDLYEQYKKNNYGTTNSSRSVENRHH